MRGVDEYVGESWVEGLVKKGKMRREKDLER